MMLALPSRCCAVRDHPSAERARHSGGAAAVDSAVHTQGRQRGQINPTEGLAQATACLPASPPLPDLSPLLTRRLRQPLEGFLPSCPAPPFLSRASPVPLPHAYGLTVIRCCRWLNGGWGGPPQPPSHARTMSIRTSVTRSTAVICACATEMHAGVRHIGPNRVTSLTS